MRIETVETLPLVNVDPDRMTQVLVNIIDNSLRYTPEGGMIRMSAQELRGKISLEIEDTGPGIPAEEIDHLFERFYRGDKSRQREAGGSGLGLAIAKSLVESQNGQITVESLPGQGAKFVITLPVDGD